MSVSQSPQTIQVNFVSSDSSILDSASVSTTAHDLVTRLEQDGYVVRPVYTSQRGGVVFEVVLQAAQLVRDNKDILIPLISLATPIVQYLLKRREAQVKQTPDQPPFEVVVVVDRQEIPIQAEDAQTDAQLLETLLRADPTLQQTATDARDIAIQVQIAPRSPRDL